MDYLQVAKKLNFSEDFDYSLFADEDSYGCFVDNRFYWIEKDVFNNFLLYNLPGIFFQSVDDLYPNHPRSVASRLSDFFQSPEAALNILMDYQDTVGANIDLPNAYSIILDFCFKHLNPKSSVRWIGKCIDLLKDNNDFAGSQRILFHGTADHIPMNEFSSFCAFLNDVNYLHKLKEEYEIGLEFQSEIEQMSDEKDYYFPSAKESLTDLHDLMKNKQSHKNLTTIAQKLFPGISFGLTDNHL